MSGERVTTGSEPRTYDLRLCSKCDEAVERNFRERWECPVHGDGITIRFMKAQVVESGHDEQTEAALDRLDVHIERANAVWQPDPRTVAAVVEALREVADELAPYEPAQASGVLIAKGRIEERFKPSAPGGDDGH